MSILEAEISLGGCYLRIPTTVPPQYFFLCYSWQVTIYFLFLFPFFFLNKNHLTGRAPGLCCLFVLFDANGRLSNHLLERASESPRSRRQMFCSAVVNGSFLCELYPQQEISSGADFTNRQVNRLRNCAVPLHLWDFSQWRFGSKQALLCLPARLNAQEWHRCVPGSVWKGHRDVGRVRTLGDRGRWG